MVRQGTRPPPANGPAAFTGQTAGAAAVASSASGAPALRRPSTWESRGRGKAMAVRSRGRGKRWPWEPWPWARSRRRRRVPRGGAAPRPPPPPPAPRRAPGRPAAPPPGPHVEGLRVAERLALWALRVRALERPGAQRRLARAALAQLAMRARRG